MKGPLSSKRYWGGGDMGWGGAQKTGGPGGQISSSQQDISKLRDEKQQLNNQCATLEAKIVKRPATPTYSWPRPPVGGEDVVFALGAEASSTFSTSLLPDSHMQIHATEKERVNEEHITRLQSTIERMLKESNERMKTHLNERKALSEEKNFLIDKVQALQKELEELKREKSQLLQQKE
ncbi:hypothetical protein EMCRGX_G010688 [Ephydatia muelleri]